MSTAPNVVSIDGSPSFNARVGKRIPTVEAVHGRFGMTAMDARDGAAKAIDFFRNSGAKTARVYRHGSITKMTRAQFSKIAELPVAA